MTGQQVARSEDRSPWNERALQAGGLVAAGAAFFLVHPWSLILGMAGAAAAATGWGLPRCRRRLAEAARERLGREDAEQRLQALDRQLAGVRQELGRIHAGLSCQAEVLVDGRARLSDQGQVLEQATGDMSSWLSEVGGSIERLSSSTEETSSSVFEMVATIEEVARHIEGVAGQVNETASSTSSLVETIKGVDSHVDGLKEFVTQTSGTLEQVTVAIRQVENRTADSNALSELVAGNAEGGMRAVQLTIEGMDRIRGSVGEASDAITQLGRRSQEIGGILNVIDEVAEQTNLLALNAAIIAAQAGEHGKGFAVVADEIRGLAERTATSTREIGSLIEFFQQEAGRAGKSMKEGSRQVEEGAGLAQQAGEALTKILDSARESSAMAGEIAQTTQEQVQGTQIVVEAVGRLRDMVSQLSSITAEQTTRSGTILSTVSRTRELSDQVKRATMEQAKGGRLITEAIRSVTDSVASIHQATMKQDTENDAIAAALESFRATGEEGSASLQQVMGASRELQELLQALPVDDGPVT
jgi:methyl-accepting chemotaxis protein